MTNKILVLDDDQAVLLHTVELLQPLGCEVRQATSVMEALIQLLIWQPDLFILDPYIGLSAEPVDAVPVSSAGFQLLEEVQIGWLPPTIALMRRLQEHDFNAVWQYGVSAVLAKPCRPTTLQATVYRLIRTSKAPVPEDETLVFPFCTRGCLRREFSKN